GGGPKAPSAGGESLLEAGGRVVAWSMIPVLEAVPNFSEGRDLDWLQELVHALGRAGVEVLDWTADPDHNRSVVTFVGDPASVESAAVAAARFAMEHIDLRSHRGV